MIIEIIQSGGIYCYKQNNNILYVGKTKNFSIRDYQHRNNYENPTEFEQTLMQCSNIVLDILYDCAMCPLSAEQLDYLETCFIKLLNPKYNIQKINYTITNIKESLNIQSIHNNNCNNDAITLSKSDIIILDAIKNNFNKNSTFTKKELIAKITITISNSTIKRAFKKFLELNIIQLLYKNNNSENVYQLV